MEYKYSTWGDSKQTAEKAKYICENANTMSYYKLSLDTELSEKTIRKILKMNGIIKQAPVVRKKEQVPRVHPRTEQSNEILRLHKLGYTLTEISNMVACRRQNARATLSYYGEKPNVKNTLDKRITICKYGYVDVYIEKEERIKYNIGVSRIKEHRLVMIRYLGRDLLKDENVHHLNGNRQDNRLDNLELWSKKQPSGQRVVDKIKYAKEILEQYKDFVPNKTGESHEQ